MVYMVMSNSRNITTSERSTLVKEHVVKMERRG